MEHHRHCNDPQLDPDYKIHAKDGWAFLAQHIRNLQPGSEEGAAYGATTRKGNVQGLADGAHLEAVNQKTNYEAQARKVLLES